MTSTQHPLHAERRKRTVLRLSAFSCARPGSTRTQAKLLHIGKVLMPNGHVGIPLAKALEDVQVPWPSNDAHTQTHALYEDGLSSNRVIFDKKDETR